MTAGKIKIHIKNNTASPDTFPPTPEGEAVFALTAERFAAAAARYPDVAARVEAVIDRDLNRFAESMKTAQVLVCWDFPTANLAQVAPHLRWIHIIGAGVEHLCPMDWLPPGVVVVNNRGAHAQKGGEFGLMAVLMLNGRLPPIIANQQKHKWESLYAGPAAGKTVVVLGLGGIGGAVAAKCKQAGLYVVGVSRHGRAVPAADEVFAAGELDAVLPRADFLFVAVPHTPETENLLDRRRQALLKPGAGVINAGRAGTMDYDALADNLRGGHIGGAILDVFAPEPLPSSSALWDAPNLIITPHVAADDGDNYAAVTLDLLFQNLRRDLNGEPLQNIVRPALGY